MSTFLDKLRDFNRKERFYLVGAALGNQAFRLGDSFRESLEGLFGSAIPPDPFVAMDYHFSWLYAAAVVSQQGGDGPFVAGGGIDRGNQEDIDLLVAYDNGPITEVLILEAKGVTSWSNSQLKSKVERLGLIFGTKEVPSPFPFLRPHFAILSPIESKQIKTADWPTWMLRDGPPYWMRLPTPRTLSKVTRCNSAGMVSAGGGHWKVVPDYVSAHQPKDE